MPGMGPAQLVQLMQWTSDASLLHSLNPMGGIGNTLHELSDLQQKCDMRGLETFYILHCIVFNGRYRTMSGLELS
jgi:hypothetical protein